MKQTGKQGWLNKPDKRPLKKAIYEKTIDEKSVYEKYVY